MAYDAKVIEEDVEERGRGFYIYRRSPCSCELRAMQNMEESQRAEKQETYRQALLQHSGLTVGKLARMSLSTFKREPGNSEALDAADRFIREYPQTAGLVIAGPFGRGKTHLAAGIARTLINSLHRVEFWQAYSLLDSLRIRKERDETQSRYEVEHFVDVPLLVVDDLGKERLTDWGREQIFHTFDQRDVMERPTLVTTNLSIPELEDHVGGAVVSRLMGSCRWVEIGGVDHRLEARHDDRERHPDRTD